MSRKLITAYYRGLKDGVTRIADGQQLRDALVKIDLEEQDALDHIEDLRGFSRQSGYSRIGLRNV